MGVPILSYPIILFKGRAPIIFYSTILFQGRVGSLFYSVLERDAYFKGRGVSVLYDMF